MEARGQAVTAIDSKGERVGVLPARRLIALVLAAGKGARVGGPKALLLVDGAPLARAHVEARLADCDRVVVVTRRAIGDALATHDWPTARVRIVISDAPDEDGPAGSIAAAVSAHTLDDDARVLVTPVDVRPAQTRTINLLLQAIDDRHLAARFAHGHPIACRGDVLNRGYAPSVDGRPPPLREVLRALGDATRVLPDADDRAVREELDEIDDVIRATGAPPRFWSPA
jgi:molybdenum cofactor cytidylyltransferase